MAKCRRNVENFLEACRKIGVAEVKPLLIVVFQFSHSLISFWELGVFFFFVLSPLVMTCVRMIIWAANSHFASDYLLVTTKCGTEKHCCSHRYFSHEKTFHVFVVLCLSAPLFFFFVIMVRSRSKVILTSVTAACGLLLSPSAEESTVYLSVLFYSIMNSFLWGIRQKSLN